MYKWNEFIGHGVLLQLCFTDSEMEHAHGKELDIRGKGEYSMELYFIVVILLKNIW